MAEDLRETSLDALDDGFAIDSVHLVSGSALPEVRARGGQFVNVRMSGIRMPGAGLRAVRFDDVLAEDLDAAGADWTGGGLNRVIFRRARLTGVQLPEAEVRDVTFSDCKLDYANFRMAKLAHVTFERCVFIETDFGGAELSLVRFDDCQIAKMDITKATFSRVDLRGSAVGFVGSVSALRGAIINTNQLMDLAHDLASELGIEVNDDD
jgi:uncharacterized protein YjbI with pentapeptide repeats